MQFSYGVENLEVHLPAVSYMIPKPPASVDYIPIEAGPPIPQAQPQPYAGPEPALVPKFTALTQTPTPTLAPAPAPAAAGGRLETHVFALTSKAPAEPQASGNKILYSDIASFTAFSEDASGPTRAPKVSTVGKKCPTTPGTVTVPVYITVSVPVYITTTATTTTTITETATKTARCETPTSSADPEPESGTGSELTLEQPNEPFYTDPNWNGTEAYGPALCGSGTAGFTGPTGGLAPTGYSRGIGTPALMGSYAEGENWGGVKYNTPPKPTAILSDYEVPNYFFGY